MKNAIKIKTGMPVWLLPKTFRHGTDRELEKTTITKVGAKYFEVKGYNGRFHIDSMTEDAEVGYPGKIYLSDKVFLDEKEREELRVKMMSKFGTGIKNDLQLLRAVNNVVICSAYSGAEYTALGVELPAKDVYVSLQEFEEKGGVLTEGRELFGYKDKEYSLRGEWIGYDDVQKVNLAKNPTYKSFPVSETAAYVKLKAVPIYR